MYNEKYISRFKAEERRDNMDNTAVSQIFKTAEKISANIEKVIIGKSDKIEKVLISMLCSGHILLEDIPGTGKTTLAKALASSVGCTFSRIQFTPDLLPSDLTGINYYNQNKGEFIFKPGPVFTNILLADEINRTTPRTQSSLLECMEERQVTIDGTTHALQRPFLVIATQNPVETHGTFPLPEAQLDRFFMRLNMGYPDSESEQKMLENLNGGVSADRLNQVADAQEIIDAQNAVNEIRVCPKVCEYIVNIVNATRNNEKIRLGVSPRGSIALIKAARACAALSSRNYAIPDDVKKVAEDVLAHRIICRTRSSGLSQSEAAAQIIREVLESVPAPVVN